MTYPNMDLQSLPAVIDLRVGTDAVERALQLSYWQMYAALQGVHAIDEGTQYPEQVVNAGEEVAFNAAIVTLKAALVAAGAQFDVIWALVP